MDLLDHLSRSFVKWDHLLAETIRVLQQPEAPAAQPTRTRQAQRRLSPADQKAVAERYRAGATMKELAAKYGVHRTSISNCLRRQSVPIRVQGLRDEDTPEAARLYVEGWSLSQLGEKYGCHPTDVHAKLIAHGIQMRPRPGWKY